MWNKAMDILILNTVILVVLFGKMDIILLIAVILYGIFGELDLLKNDSADGSLYF